MKCYFLGCDQEVPFSGMGCPLPHDADGRPMFAPVKTQGSPQRPTARDRADFSGAAQKILTMMLDGAWYAATMIIDVSGQREGLRRLRELRAGYEVERRRNGASREFEYRLRTPEVNQ